MPSVAVKEYLEKIQRLEREAILDAIIEAHPDVEELNRRLVHVAALEARISSLEKIIYLEDVQNINDFLILKGRELVSTIKKFTAKKREEIIKFADEERLDLKSLRENNLRKAISIFSDKEKYITTFQQKKEYI